MPISKSGGPDIGLNTDAAGVSTVFARLKQIVDTYLANATIGLAALKTLIDVSQTDVKAIIADLNNPTDGLGALKALLDINQADLNTIIADLGNETDGLGALKTLIDANQTDLNSILADVGDASESTLGSLLGILGDPATPLGDWIQDLYEEAFHLNFLFPEDSDETVLFTAGVGDNDFGAWVEIVDNNSVTLSSKFTSTGHISSVIAEATSDKDVIYIWEIAYGEVKTIVVRGRMLSATNKIPHTSQDRMRNLEIPNGETIYYRMKCETGGATLTVHLRYHIHT